MKIFPGLMNGKIVICIALRQLCGQSRGTKIKKPAEQVGIGINSLTPSVYVGSSVGGVGKNKAETNRNALLAKGDKHSVIPVDTIIPNVETTHVGSLPECIRSGGVGGDQLHNIGGVRKFD